MTRLSRRPDRPVEGRRSLIDHLADDPRTASELAAADAVTRVHALMNRALENQPRTQRELADILRVSEGRVSQVLAGFDDLKVSTVARYMSALGHTWDMTCDPISRAERSDRQTADVYVTAIVEGDVTHPQVTFVPAGVKPVPAVGIHGGSVRSADNHLSEIRVVNRPMKAGLSS